MARAHLIAVRLLRQPDGSEPDEAPLPIAATGAVIGRSPDCDVVLEDPLRLVSRQHAQLVPQGGDSALLRCISASVSIGVNGEALPPGGERLVKAGDRLRIGGFELQIEVPAVAALPEAPAVSPLQMLEEVLGSKAAASAAASPAMQPASAAPVVAPVVASIAAPVARSRLDAWFDLETVADPLAPGSPLPATDAPTAVAPAPAPATTSPAAAIPAAPAAAVPAPMPAPEPSPAASPASGDHAALLQAFVRGAGLNGTALPGTAVNAAWLQHLGAVLRAATEGTLALLRSRAVTKRSIRAEGTRIAPRENNPLKFAPDAAEALALLVGKNSAQGFLDPVEALHDAHNDLLVHQLAMVAGMRAAVFELISRLGPEAIETQQGQPQGWAKHLPLLHDAALWRRHRAQHAHLIANLDDDFETVFGREFLLAYEAQAKLAAAQKAPPSAQV